MSAADVPGKALLQVAESAMGRGNAISISTIMKPLQGFKEFLVADILLYKNINPQYL
jgi:hypothetical protein